MTAVNVMKCDRCHKLYEAKDQKLVIHKKAQNTMTRIDLCPDCELDMMKMIGISRVQAGGV